MIRRPEQLPAFDPEPHREALEGIVRAVASSLAAGDFDAGALDGILRRFPRAGRGFFSRAEIIQGFRHFFDEDALEVSDETFLAGVQRRPTRTVSGVTPLTVLTKPFPCPGKCIFCPNDVRMPKSYLSDEPGAQRAAANRFDPYLQTWNRLAAFRAIGHPVEKVELIVLGGTWSFLPEAYQVWFATRCFEALNDFGAGRDGRAAVHPSAPRFEALPARLDGRAGEGTPYNRIVQGFLKERLDGAMVHPDEEAAWERLEAAQRANVSAGCRSVGFVIETRPDHVTPEEVLRIRRLGATKVQLGIQSLDDAVLHANARGHDADASRRAVSLLRRAGFKVHAHWMPNLLGSTPARDMEDFARLFDDPALRPDELKIYPCSLIESAELMQHWERGEWRPYEYDELLEVLASALARVPRYCRVTRVVRDISSDDIVTGNKLTNFRQLAEREVARRGGSCRDIRAREIRGDDFDADALVLRETRYDAGVAEERFLELTTPDDRIVGFLRLSLPKEPGFVAELGDAAIVREVHVYGMTLGIGDRAEGRPQHRGLGGRLLDEAVRRAAEAGYASLGVISAVGTRDWYRRHGFEERGLYQLRDIRATQAREEACMERRPPASER